PAKPSGAPDSSTTGSARSFIVESMSMKAMTRPLMTQPIQKGRPRPVGSTCMRSSACSRRLILNSARITCLVQKRQLPLVPDDARGREPDELFQRAREMRLIEEAGFVHRVADRHAAPQ